VGEARRRGPREERQAAALARRAAEEQAYLEARMAHWASLTAEQRAHAIRTERRAAARLQGLAMLAGLSLSASGCDLFYEGDKP
jgi:hypothetical protein